MNVLITGSAGFIGNYLVRELVKSGHSIIELDVSKGINICNWDEIKEISGFDTCIHLAARSFVPDSYSDPRTFYHLNFVGTLNMLELCRINSARFIFTSSYVYGKPRYLPIDEEHEVSPFNPYAHSKILGEQLCRSYHDYFNVPVIIFRPFNLYGKGQSSRFLIPEIMAQLKTGGQIRLLDPHPKRDMLHVEDLARAFGLILNTGFGFETINLGSGISYSVDEIVQLISKNLPGKVTVEYGNSSRKNEVDDVVADISRAKTLINWSPAISIENGLIRLMKEEGLLG
jgi:UDP-glucose 4-epimerase